MNVCGNKVEKEISDINVEAGRVSMRTRAGAYRRCNVSAAIRSGKAAIATFPPLKEEESWHSNLKPIFGLLVFLFLHLHLVTG